MIFSMNRIIGGTSRNTIGFVLVSAFFSPSKDIKGNTKEGSEVKSLLTDSG